MLRSRSNVECQGRSGAYNCADGNVMMMTCRICHRAAALDQAHDALACLQCDTWIELACDTPDCWACGDRPNRPSQATRKSASSGETDQGSGHFLFRLMRLVPLDEQIHTLEAYSELSTWFQTEAAKRKAATCQ